MLLTIDNLATRYHVLPSEAARNADTFDLIVLDLSSKWNKRQHDIQQNGGVEPQPELTQEQMAMILYGDRTDVQSDTDRHSNAATKRP